MVESSRSSTWVSALRCSLSETRSTDIASRRRSPPHAAVTLSAAGCISHTVAGNPTTASPTTTSVALPQAELLHDFAAEQAPDGRLQRGVLLPASSADGPHPWRSLGIGTCVATDGAASKVAAFAFMPPTGARGKRSPTESQCGHPARPNGLETDRTEALITRTPPAVAARPTVKGVSDAGTSYYTFSYQGPGRARLCRKVGWRPGSTKGVGLPQSAQADKFSPGARAYLMTETSVDPFFTIHRIGHADTRHR